MIHRILLPIGDVEAGHIVHAAHNGEQIKTCNPFTWNDGAYGHYVRDGAPITNADFAVKAHPEHRI